MHSQEAPDDIHGNDTTKVCVTFPPKINSGGIWDNITSPSEILSYSLPFLELQMLLAFFITHLLHLFLNRLGLGIPILASQIIAGLMLGPMMLGNVEAFKAISVHANIFLLEVIDTAAVFGFALFMFLMGVKMDVKGAFSSGKTAKMIGILSFLTPFIFGLIVNGLMGDKNLSNEAKVERVAITLSESMTSVSVIACLLSELKILNSELGRLALSSAIVGDFSSLIIFFGISLPKRWSNSIIAASMNIGGLILFVIVLVFVLRPFMFWIIKRTPPGKPIEEKYIYIVLLLAFGCALYAHFFDRSPIFGAFLFGLIAVPAGPPLGSALVDKLECFVSGGMLSLFVTTASMRVDPMRLSADPAEVHFCATIGVVTFLAKFIGTFIPSFCSKMPLKDSLALALIMTSKGIVELSVLSNLKDSKVIQDATYCVLILGTLLNSIVVPILVKFLYDPISRKYVGYQKRTIMHLEPNSELRILACVHKPENAIALIGFLNATCPTEESPNVVYVLHLMELIGRDTPLFITHQKEMIAGSSYENFIMAFNQYEQNNFGLVTMNAFTAISPPDMMHEDVCTMALDKQTSLILLPFHRKWSIGGSIETENNAIRMLNCNVLETCPCSIGILIDRDNASTIMLTNSQSRSSCYNVCMIFIGGKDDREALTLAKRMSKDTRLSLTVTRFVSGEEAGDNNLMLDWEGMLDDQVLKDVKHSQTGEYGEITYIEEIVRDGPQAAKLVKSIACGYDLVIVGRRYGVQSVQTQGLSEWSEFPELGGIGDLLASTDLQTTTSVLVVQQQHYVDVDVDKN
ncbi:Cation/H+ exchanger [Corchorus capsularis]|uniref:Cation/H+ exchanger n=1 Tax=Corchorus capsularis TaxID=210143 RepID=A0A1R3FV00_COCAP|nr:Cation/H+ exchanger [Corchorus capsularis]